MQDTLLEIDGLSRIFPLGRGRALRAVDRVHLSIAEREVLGLVGESGSGKSTLGKTVLGLWEASEGEVRWRGEALPRRFAPSEIGRAHV